MIKWIGTDDAANLTGLSRRTLQEYAEDGRIPSFKVGPKVLFRQDEIEAWMEAHRRPVVQRNAR